jgi:uncharacterized Tic20 family protein
MRPGPGPDDHPPAVPPDVERRLRELSQPGRTADPYVLAPPPTAPPQTQVGTRVVETAGRAADAGLAALAHFAILFGFFGVGFLLSLAISGAIWLYSRRSPYVAFHAQQAGCYQIFVLVFNIGYWVLLGALVYVGGQLHWEAGTITAVVTLMIGLFILWFVLSILYGAWAGLRVLLGHDFRYPYFGRARNLPRER